MRKAESDLVELLKARDRAQDRLDKRYDGLIAAAKKKLDKDECSHSLTQEYKWEWDNGYGSQKMLSGLLCLVCGKKNSWPGSSSWLDPFKQGARE